MITYSTWRMIIRRIFDPIYIRTDKVLLKDIQCYWVALCVQLTKLSYHLESNGELSKTIELLECIKYALIGTNNTLLAICNDEEKLINDETYRNLHLNLGSYHEMLADVGHAYDRVRDFVLTGKDISEISSIVNNDMCKPIFTDVSVIRLISGSVMRGTFDDLVRITKTDRN